MQESVCTLASTPVTLSVGVRNTHLPALYYVIGFRQGLPVKAEYAPPDEKECDQLSIFAVSVVASKLSLLGSWKASDTSFSCRTIFHRTLSLVHLWAY